jgi:hypothetical protein
MSALKDQAAPEDEQIARRMVPEADRIEFLPKHTGSRFLQFEQLVYHFADTQSDYTGGYWEFYELSNDGWYIAPKLDGALRFECPNGFAGELSADAAGIALSLLGVNALLWSVHEKDPPLGLKLTEAFYALRDYAAQHQEGAAIFGVID